MPETPADTFDDERLVRRLAAELQAMPDVLGAIWMGSRARGEGIGASSDIDIVAVIDEASGPKRRRGFRDETTGRHVELLFRAPSLDRLRFRECVESGESWPHGYVTGRVLFDKDGTLAALTGEARAIWQQGPAAIKAGDREWERYEMWLQRADIADRLREPEVTAHLAGALFDRLIRFGYRLERRWYPPDKYLLRDLEMHDEEVASAFRRIYAADATPTTRLETLDALFATLAHRHGIVFDAPYASPQAEAPA